MASEHRPIILAVDDEPANLGVLFQLLRQANFKVLVAEDGTGALATIQRVQPDVILLDIKLPDLDGFELYQLMKDRHHLNGTTVIFLSVFSDTAKKLKALDMNAVDYITKPFESEEVIARVQKHLLIRKLQKQLEEHNARLQEEIAERKRIEEELQRAKVAAEAANQAKSAFLANMSHELRTPLTAILGFSELMAHNPAIPAEEQEHLTIIQRSGQHLLTLINQVLDLSKIEAGRLTLNETEVELYQLLDDLKEMFSLRAEEKGLQLRFDCADEVPCTVRTDEVKLRQVLINLLNNAIKFTHTGGVTVHLECQSLALTCESRAFVPQPQESESSALTRESRAFALQFAIQDTGPGIAPEDREQIFEAFGQTAAGRQAREGTGLGLTISRKFVQLMGGDLRVSSEVGVGSTFSFDITVECVKQTLLDKRQAFTNIRPVAIEPRQLQYRLLIADGNPENRKLFVTLLAPFDFDLREAVNGQEAFDVWHDWQPHLIWIDLRIPIMDGYEVIQRIRAMESSRTTKIIAVSASSFEDERSTVLAQGGDDFLRKPFREAEIFARLEQHLDLRFVYARKPPAPISSDEDVDLDVLATAITDLPSNISAKFFQVTRECNLPQMYDLIAQIRPEHQAVADILTRLTDNYQYERLLKLFKNND